MTHLIIFEPWKLRNELALVLEELSSSGYEVSIISKEKCPPNLYAVNWELVNINDHDALCEAFDRISLRSRVDGILCLEDRGVIPASRLAADNGLIGPRPSSCVIAGHKFHSKELLSQGGVLSPRRLLIDDYNDFDLARERLGLPFILKPVSTSGSVGIWLITDKSSFESSLEELRTHCIPRYLERLPQFGSKLVAEEYKSGKLVSVNAIVSNGRIVSQFVVDHFSKYPRYLDEFHIVPSSIHKDKIEEIHHLSQTVISLLDYQYGPIQIEYIVCDDGNYLIDIALRPGADYLVTDLIPNMYGYNFITNAANVLCNTEPFHFQYDGSQLDGYRAIKFIMAMREGSFQNITFPISYGGKLDICAARQELQHGENISLPPNCYETIRVGSLTVAAKQREHLEIELEDYISNIDILIG
jgi:biotin carboxylase